MDMHEQLRKLYESHWPALCNALRPIVNNSEYSIKPSNPLLLFPGMTDYEYDNADIRVMIFGQENNDWGGVFNSEAPVEDEVERILEVYNSFYNVEFNYVSQFWNGYKLFMRMLNAKYPNKTIKYAWNNIVKIGKAFEMHLPPAYIYEEELKHFNIVKNEIEILKPHVILFLTGPYYDGKIMDKLPEAKIIPFADNIMKVEIPNVDFAYRTYHPKNTYFKGKGYTESLYEQIIKDINL